MKLVEKCNLCSKQVFESILESEDLMYNLDGKFKLVKCKNCSLMFENPQPNEKELLNHYPSQYYSISVLPKKSKFAEVVYKTYSDNGNLLLKILFYPIRPLIRGSKIVKNGKILDIGCGSGVFLERMKQLGMEIYGIDPFIEKDILELNIKKQAIEENHFSKNYFDVITANNVLEHVGDPYAYLSEIQRMLKINGTAIIAFPNINRILFKIFKKNWAELDLPRHMYFFNEKTFKQYCRKYNLKVIKVRYNSIPFGIMGSIFYFINSFRINRKDLSESFIVNNRIINLLFLPLCHILNIFKSGDRLEFYITKE